MRELSSASAADLVVIRALLEASQLPTSDLRAARAEFAVIRESGQVVAAGALQRFGSAALLRSVVVTPDRRRSGLGQLIVAELERLARCSKVTRVILLTQTATQFFARQGYAVIERGAAPKDMQESEEFRSLCPNSAICMTKSLTD
jgi:amino-acid N-acetyltransferase